MLAYAANRPQVAVRRPSPKALLLIVGGHVAVLGLVMTAKMDLPQSLVPSRTTVELIRDKTPPPPNDLKRTQPRQAEQSQLTQPQRQAEIPIQVSSGEAAAKLPNIGDLLGPAIPQPPRFDPQPLPTPAPTIAQLLTPPAELKPPYPESKLLTGEEAVLNLRLTISEQGRVVAVDPIGRADRVFLEAARRYLMAHWRYKPATRDGQPAGSTVAITLRFELG